MGKGTPGEPVYPGLFLGGKGGSEAVVGTHVGIVPSHSTVSSTMFLSSSACSTSDLNQLLLLHLSQTRNRIASSAGLKQENQKQAPGSSSTISCVSTYIVLELIDWASTMSFFYQLPLEWHSIAEVL